MSTVIKVENLSKEYRLGTIGHNYLFRDLQSAWARLRGKEDPNQKMGAGQVAKGKYRALDDVSFEVKQGEVLGIIGRNGAGKSTLLKILSRVTTPTQGSIKVKGRIASLLEVGTGFHPELTGRENIFLNGAILGMSKNEVKAKFDEIVDFAGIGEFIDTPVKRYSSGMYVRLAFAVAAHLEPEILIIDEVLAVGDAEFQKKCLGKMKDVAGEGRTVLFVSHNMGAVQNLCGSAILLEKGQMKFSGRTGDVVEEYLKRNYSDQGTRHVKFTENKNNVITFLSASIQADAKEENVVLDIHDKLKVIIEYKVNEDNLKGTNVSIAIAKEGVVLFRSWDIDNSPDLLAERKRGKYKVEVDLPNSLNIGNYLLSIACGRPNIGVIEEHTDCISFTLENKKINGSLRSFTRGGVFRTSLKWNIR